MIYLRKHRNEMLKPNFSLEISSAKYYMKLHAMEKKPAVFHIRSTRNSIPAAHSEKFNSRHLDPNVMIKMPNECKEKSEGTIEKRSTSLEPENKIEENQQDAGKILVTDHWVQQKFVNYGNKIVT